VPSLAFCAQWFRVEVDAATGLVRVLDSVHVADAGTVMDAEQCRGQVEGAVVQGIGITLHEHLLGDGDGRITTSDPRTYGIPRFGDAPLTEVHLLPPHSGDRPASPKPMSELPLVTAAPALANALRDATGIRFTTLPVRPDTCGRHSRRLRPQRRRTGTDGFPRGSGGYTEVFLRGCQCNVT